MVDEPESRVLVDLSLAALGYSGIPQETRLLFKSLCQVSGVHTTGLVYSMASTSMRPRSPRSNSPDTKITHQAELLHHILGSDEPGGQRWWDRLAKGWRALRSAWQSLFSRENSLEELDSETFWDVIWRRLLSQSLNDDDRDLARRPILLSDLTRPSLNRRAHLGLCGPRLDTTGFDFALFHEARPIRVSRSTCKLVRHYDMIPVVRPDLITSTKHIRAQAGGVRACLKDSIFTCISEAVREDLVRMFPEVAERAVTIPCTLPDGYYPDHRPGLLPAIATNYQSNAASPHPPGRNRKMHKSGVPPYLLVVCTIEPRKNHLALLRAFEQVLARRDTELRLVVVGAPGWLVEEPLRQMATLINRGAMIHLERVPLPELRVLYSHARATIFPSLYEGFGYSPLESMCCGTPVIASDIAVHRDVYGDAVRYCDPYAIDSITDAIEYVCLDADPAARAAMSVRGFRRASRYRVAATGAQWRALLAELRRQGITHNVVDARLADFNHELRRIEAAREVAGDDRKERNLECHFPTTTATGRMLSGSSELAAWQSSP